MAEPHQPMDHPLPSPPSLYHPAPELAELRASRPVAPVRPRPGNPEEKRDMWSVRVSDACIGSGGCIGLAPERFRLREDFRSEPVTAEIEPDELVRDAAASCPMEAIQLTDLSTGKPVEL
jgi:ferredoxin